MFLNSILKLALRDVAMYLLVGEHLRTAVAGVVAGDRAVTAIRLVRAFMLHDVKLQAAMV